MSYVGVQEKQIIQFTQTELEAYEYYFNLLDPNNTKMIDGKQLVSFFRKSQLSNQVLKEIWVLCAPNGEFIDHEGFFQSLKLISIAQNTNLPISLATLAQNIQTPLPTFADVFYPPPQQPNPIQPSIQNSQLYEMTQDQFSRYEQYYSSIDRLNKGSISGIEAKQLFIKTSLPKDQLIELWYITDIGEKGYLYKGEFIVAIHLINVATKGIPLPNILPDQLAQIAKGNFKIFQAQRPRLGSNSNLSLQPRIGSNLNQPRIGSNANLSLQPRVGSNANLGSIQPIQINQGPFTNLYNSILSDKEVELQYLKQVNDNYRIFVGAIQTQYQQFQNEFLQLQNEKMALQMSNENFRKEISRLLAQNQELQTTLFQDSKQQPPTQSQAFQQPRTDIQPHSYNTQNTITPTPCDDSSLSFMNPVPQQYTLQTQQHNYPRDSDITNLFNGSVQPTKQQIQRQQPLVSQPTQPLNQSNPFSDFTQLSDELSMRQNPSSSYDQPWGQAQQQQGFYR